MIIFINFIDFVSVFIYVLFMGLVNKESEMNGRH